MFRHEISGQFYSNITVLTDVFSLS